MRRRRSSSISRLQQVHPRQRRQQLLQPLRLSRRLRRQSVRASLVSVPVPVAALVGLHTVTRFWMMMMTMTPTLRRNLRQRLQWRPWQPLPPAAPAATVSVVPAARSLVAVTRTPPTTIPRTRSAAMRTTRLNASFGSRTQRRRRQRHKQQRKPSPPPPQQQQRRRLHQRRHRCMSGHQSRQRQHQLLRLQQQSCRQQRPPLFQQQPSPQPPLRPPQPPSLLLALRQRHVRALSLRHGQRRQAQRQLRPQLQ